MTEHRDAPEPDPFALTANPDRYFPTAAIERVLADAVAALDAGRVPVIAGPTGLGKTLTLQLLARARARASRPLYIPFCTLSPADLATLALGLLDCVAGTTPERQLLEEARRSAESGRPLLLLIDDAAALPGETAAQLAHWLGGAGGTLQIALAGLPGASLRHVRDAFGDRAEELLLAGGLHPEELGGYVRARLAASALETEFAAAFDAPALAELARVSEGNPRRVNLAAQAILRAARGEAREGEASRDAQAPIAAEAAPTWKSPASPASHDLESVGAYRFVRGRFVDPESGQVIGGEAVPRIDEGASAPSRTLRTPAPPSGPESVLASMPELDSDWEEDFEEEAEDTWDAPGDAAAGSLFEGPSAALAEAAARARSTSPEDRALAREAAFEAQAEADARRRDARAASSAIAPGGSGRDAFDRELAAGTVPYTPDLLDEPTAPKGVDSPMRWIGAGIALLAFAIGVAWQLNDKEPPVLRVEEGGPTAEVVTVKPRLVGEPEALPPAPAADVTGGLVPTADTAGAPAGSAARPDTAGAPAGSVPTAAAAGVEPVPARSGPLAALPRPAAEPAPAVVAPTGELASATPPPEEPATPPQAAEVAPAPGPQPVVASTPAAPEPVTSVPQPHVAPAPEAPPAPDAETVGVAINATPWAIIEVDGAEIGETPLAGIQLSVGRHRFRARMPDGTTRERVIRVDAANTAVVFE